MEYPRRRLKSLTAAILCVFSGAAGATNKIAVSIGLAAVAGILLFLEE